MSTFNKVFFAFLVIAFSGSSNASMVTVNGTTVSYSYDSTLVGLFGTPSVVGDALKFNPSLFATSATTGGFNFLDNTFVVTINANAGHALLNVGLTETGNYKLLGAGAYIAAIGTLTDSNSQQIANAFFYDKTNTAGFSQGLWQQSTSLDYSLISSTVVSLNNFLLADTTSGGSLAQINKFDVKLSALTVPTSIPLPMAVWMFGAGLFGMLSVSKRKKTF